MTPVFALLADGRFPTGGHAHSAGYEAASSVFGLDDPVSLGRFVAGRLTTTGRTDAHLVAALIHRLRASRTPTGSPVDWEIADREIDARILSPALRGVSRSLGRQWVRAGRRLWDPPVLVDLAAACPDGPHQVAAYAVVADAAGLGPRDAAVVHLHHLVAAVATAAVRLHGLDPYGTQACQLAAAGLVDELAHEAADMAAEPLDSLPATTGPLTEILAEEHARWDMRLFQS